MAEVSVETLAQLLDFIACLQSPNGSHEKLYSRAHEQLIGSIQCFSHSGRTHLIIYICGVPLAFRDSGEELRSSGIQLGASLTLQRRLRHAFAQSADKVKLPKIFTTANLEMIADIQVRWNSNLVDHLSRRDGGTKVMLYHQASFNCTMSLSSADFLNKHCWACAKHSIRTIRGVGLIEANILLCALLTPSNDLRSQSWSKKKRGKLHLDLIGHCSTAEY